jgi:hypothetical protein
VMIPAMIQPLSPDERFRLFVPVWILRLVGRPVQQLFLHGKGEELFRCLPRPVRHGLVQAVIANQKESHLPAGFVDLPDDVELQLGNIASFGTQSILNVRP